MTVESETRAAERPNIDMPVSLSLRWVSVGEAATLLGVSEVAIRKRLADRSLTGLRLGRSWRVLLAGQAEVRAEAASELPPPADDATRVLAQTSEALSALVRDLQRQSLSLAAQVGYLQSQLAEAQRQVKLLNERGESTVEHAPPAPSRAEYEAAQATIASLRSELEAAQSAGADATRRRGWRFWRR